MNNELIYNELIELINSVKSYSGCDEVKLIGNHKAFEELRAIGFPLTNFKCEELSEPDEPQLYIIPIIN